MTGTHPFPTLRRGSVGSAAVSEPGRPAAGSGHEPEVEVGVAAFLPEGVVPDEGRSAIDSATPPDPQDLGPVSPSEPLEGGLAAPPDPLDVEVLVGIETDLAAVDAALEAIDADDYERSPLLVELSGTNRPPRSSSSPGSSPARGSTFGSVTPDTANR